MTLRNGVPAPLSLWVRAGDEPASSTGAMAVSKKLHSVSVPA
jgi:hypothetical protein